MAKVVPFIVAAATFVATGGNIAAASFAFSITSAVVAVATPGPKPPAAQEKQASVLQLTLGEGPREFAFGTACSGGTLVSA